MPNLEQQAVTEWLVELRPDDHEAWPPAIRPIEATGQAANQLATLGTAFDEIAAIDPRRLRDGLRDDPLLTELRTVMAQFGAARALRLLHWLAEIDLPDCHEIIASLTRGPGAGARALRATVEAVTRAATVRRMFAPERIAALEAACAVVREDLA